MYCRTVTRQSMKVALISGLLLAGAFAGAPRVRAGAAPNADCEGFPTQVGALPPVLAEGVRDFGSSWRSRPK